MSHKVEINVGNPIAYIRVKDKICPAIATVGRAVFGIEYLRPLSVSMLVRAADTGNCSNR